MRHVIIVLCALLLADCCHRTYESVIRDTMTVVRVDSVLVNMREVEVDFPVPQITLQERIPLCDTLLILDNELYQSVVEIKDGQVTHTLKPSESADSLHATVVVADTTHVTATTTHTSYSEKEKIVVEKQEPWYTRLWHKVTGSVTWIIIGALLVVVFLFAVRRFIHVK